MAKIYGQLEKAQMENISSDPSSPSTALFYFNTTSSIPKWYNGSAWKTFLAADFSNVTGTLAIANGGTGQTTATLGFNALSPLTTKGDLIGTNGTTNSRTAVGVNGTVLTADSSATNGFSWQTVTPTLDSSYDQINLALSCSVSSNALTIAIKDKAGSDPSTGSPVKIGFRNSTLTNGTYNVRSVTGALSVVVSSGSTLGHSNGTQGEIYVYAIDNAGTVELAVSSTLYETFGVQSTTAEGGAGAADSATVIYSTSARSNVPIRLLGRLLSTQTTAGTWAAVPTTTALGAQNLGFGAATNLSLGLNKKNRVQLKVDTTTRTTGTSNADIIVFNNLIVGKSYKIYARCYARNGTSGAGNNAYLEIRHNGTRLFFIGFVGVDGIGNNINLSGFSGAAIFTATGTTVDVDAVVAGTGSQIYGSTSVSQPDGTVVILEELNDVEVTTAFT